MRTIAPCAAGLLLSTAALAERLPLQSDIDRCTLAAEGGGQPALQGSVRLSLMVRKTGQVYAAFVHSTKGIDSRSFQRCLTNVAVMWKLPETPIDYQRPFNISFAAASAGGTWDFSDQSYLSGNHYAVSGRTSSFLPDENRPEPVMEPDFPLAQATVDVAADASPAEQATVDLAVGHAQLAVEHARRALEENGSDPQALRVLAEALAAARGDLNEARTHAQRLVALDPASVAGHEAMLHACLAAADARCLVEQWKLALTAPDEPTRSRELAGLQEKVRATVRNLQPMAGGVDPCAAEAGPDAQTLCVVRRCLDEGTSQYARELSAQNHVELKPGAWTVSRASTDRLVVRRAITGAGERFEPIWLVTEGDHLTMKPASLLARQITLRSSCAAKNLGSR